MKNWMIVIFTGAVLALSCPCHAWVARGGGGAYHASSATYHAGYSCGGVATGTTVAHGYAGYRDGTLVRPTTQPVYVAPAYGYGYSYAVTTTPPPPVPSINAPSPGSIVYSLPPGAQMQVINGLRYYVVNTGAVTVYYQAFFGNNGVYYVVQAGPS